MQLMVTFFYHGLLAFVRELNSYLVYSSYEFKLIAFCSSHLTCPVAFTSIFCRCRRLQLDFLFEKLNSNEDLSVALLIRQ